MIFPFLSKLLLFIYCLNNIDLLLYQNKLECMRLMSSADVTNPIKSIPSKAFL